MWGGGREASDPPPHTGSVATTHESLPLSPQASDVRAINALDTQAAFQENMAEICAACSGETAVHTIALTDKASRSRFPASYAVVKIVAKDKIERVLAVHSHRVVTVCYLWRYGGGKAGKMMRYWCVLLTAPLQRFRSESCGCL